jgi:hypothetical protein
MPRPPLDNRTFASKPSRIPSVRRAKYGAKNTITMKVDMGAVNAMLADMASDIQRAVRPAAQAAANVLYKAVLKNVDAVGSHTGALHDSIYQAFSKDKSKEGENGGYVKATYHVSWNFNEAPHGHLIEFGHIQRYAVYVGKDGQWHTAVRPEHHGKKAPWVGTGKKGRNRKASQAEKDAWYVLRPGGPVQISAKPFLRPAYYQQGAAIEAAKAKLLDVLGAK